MEINKELKAFLGRVMARRESPPVSASDIRKWAIAVYWPETPPKLFWDAEYAKGTRFGGIVAPEDFNPFAWSVDAGDMFVTDNDLKEATLLMGFGGNGLNGGSSDRYYERLRPGDIVHSVTKLADVYLRQGNLGRMVFFHRESTWTNQRGQVVRISRNTSLRF